MKRYVPLLLSVVLLACFLLVPKEVWASEEPIQGYCGAEGDNFTWDLDNAGFLTIQFDSNGGTSVSKIRALPNEPITLPSDSPIRSGYNFVGWAEGRSGEALYQPGGTYHFDKSITLYAQWNKRCDACFGTGVGTKPCSTCSGSGTIEEQLICGLCKGGMYSFICCRMWTYYTAWGILKHCGGYGYTGMDCIFVRQLTCPCCYGVWDVPEHIKGHGISYEEEEAYIAAVFRDIFQACELCGGAGKRVLPYVCSDCSGGGTAASACSMCNGTGEVIRENVSAPGTPTIESFFDNTVVLNEIKNGEYSDDGIEWQDSPVFDNIDSNLTYRFYQRYAKTDTTYASEPSVALIIIAGQLAQVSGTCGNNVTWALTEDGILSIFGSGAMYDYKSGGTPWHSVREKIKSIVVEDGVTSIGAYAFKDYTNIANIMLPNSLINIGRCAFWGCKSLTILVIPDKVTDLGQCAFRNCTSLTNVTLGNSISSISDQAFQECSGLKSVTIPTSVANIGYCAFDDCSSLEEVIYQGTVSDKERIQIDAYNDCLANAAWRCGTCVGQHTYSNDCDSNCNVCGYVRETSHNYGNWKVVTKATCTTDGLERQDCVDCGDYYTRVIKATGHDWDGGKITKQPSCAAEGVKTYSCSGCGGTRTEVIAKTADHKYGSWTKVNDSTHKHSCSVCQKEETASHSWDAGKVTKQPTCKETGIKTFACVVCNATRTESIDKLTTHTYGNWTSVGGSTHKHTCTVCGKEETESHGWDGGVVTEQPTEKTEGQRRFTCQHCGATKTETIPKLDHVHNYNTVVTIPTCTAQGYTTHTCACGDSYEDTYMNALGHKDANKDHVCDNGCDISQGAHADGDDADHKCDYGCGMDNMTGHNYAKKVTTPTCLDKGFTTYTCACGDTYIADEVPANGHAEVVDAAIAASCTQSGLTEGKHCSICGAVTIKQQTVNKVPHDEIVLSGYPATHSAAGLTDGKKCSVCGKITMEQAVIPALQHTIQVIPGHPATCTEPGLTDGQKCIGCCSGAMIVEQTVIPATGHEEEVIRGTDATCTEPGLSEGFVCKTCGAELKKQEEIPVIAHAFGHWQITEEATADKNGYKTRKCDVCGHAEVEVIPATGAPETEPTQPSETTPTTPTEQPSVQPTEPTQKETEPPVNDVAGSNDDKTSVVWVVAIVAAVCLAGGLAGGLILRRKRCV